MAYLQALGYDTGGDGAGPGMDASGQQMVNPPMPGAQAVGAAPPGMVNPPQPTVGAAPAAQGGWGMRLPILGSVSYQPDQSSQGPAPVYAMSNTPTGAQDQAGQVPKLATGATTGAYPMAGWMPSGAQNGANIGKTIRNLAMLAA